MPRKPRSVVDWPALWEKFDTWCDRHWFEWEKQQQKIMALVEAQLASRRPRVVSVRKVRARRK